MRTVDIGVATGKFKIINLAKNLRDYLKKIVASNILNKFYILKKFRLITFSNLFSQVDRLPTVSSPLASA